MDKITEQDLANRGVKGLPDVPGLTTEEMQRKLEEIAREILIPKVNELVEGLNNANSNLSNLQKLDYSKKQLASASFVASRDGIICGYVNINTSSSGYYQINIDSLPIYFTTSSQGQSIPVYALINKGQNVIIASSECEINAYFVPFV